MEVGREVLPCGEENLFQALTSPLAGKNLLHLVNSQTRHASTDGALLAFAVQITLLLFHPSTCDAVATVTLGPIFKAGKLVPAV